MPEPFNRRLTLFEARPGSPSLGDRAAAAYSLMEVLVGVAAAAILCISLYIVLSGGFAIIQATREDLRATQILQEKMETIRLYTWEQLTSSNFIPRRFTAPFYATNLVTSGGAGYSGTAGLTYTGRVEITNVVIPLAAYTNDLRWVRIALTWKSGARVRTNTIGTYVSKHGLQNYIY